MHIKKSVLEKIVAISNSKLAEIGGILGSSEYGVITDVVADLPLSGKACKHAYYPNCAFLNAQIKSWAQNGIAFMGIFHTHFSGSKSLSEADKKYIVQIMHGTNKSVEYLFFPIFTFPDNELSVYKAHFEGEDVIINRDGLQII